MNNAMESEYGRLKNSQSGQAVVEYLLILVVSVAVILGGLYQFNKAFQVWADSYFGDYLACLLETGELPGLGGPDPNSVCQSQFKPFSIADGTALSGPGIGEDGAGSGSDQSSSSKGGGRSVDGFFGKSKNKGTRRNQRINARSKGGGNVTEEGEDSGGSKGGALSGATVSEIGGAQDQRNARIPIRDFDDIGGTKKKKKKTRLQNKTRITASAEEEGQAVQRDRLIPARRGPASTSKEIEIEELGFGDYFRYLVIAAIIITIVIVIGGQTLQASKSIDN